MKVLFDISTLNPKKVTGVGVYMLQLLDQLRNFEELEIQPVLKLSRWKKKKDLEHFLRSASVNIVPPWSPFLDPGTIYHGPDFQLNTRGAFSRIVTIHDMVVFEGKYSDPRFDAKGISDLSSLLNSKLDAVITNSEFSKSQILRFFPQLQGKVHVTLLGCDQRRPSVELPSGLVPENYILFLGTLEKRKNVQGLIEAFEILKSRGRAEHLVLAGGWGFGAEEIRKQIEKSTFAASIHCLNYVSEEHIQGLYKNAKVLVFPSFYEGFGIPILEAMLAGCPVVTSGSGAMAEVAGTAAVFCDPMDIESIAASTLQILENPEFAMEKRILGAQRAAQFTWSDCACETLKVYQGVRQAR